MKDLIVHHLISMLIRHVTPLNNCHYPHSLNTYFCTLSNDLIKNIISAKYIEQETMGIRY